MTARSMLAQAATKLANISDQTLQEAADTWLRREDLTGVTFKSLVSAMENQFQIDLTDKRILFKRVLEVFTLEHMKTEQDEDEDEEDEKEDMDDDDGNEIGKDEENDNDSDSDSDSDEEETGTFANSSSKRKNTSSSQSPSGKEQKGSGGGGGGFTKEVQLSNELTELLGVCMLPRTQVTKKIWEYIKSNSLQVCALPNVSWCAFYLTNCLFPFSLHIVTDCVVILVIVIVIVIVIVVVVVVVVRIHKINEKYCVMVLWRNSSKRKKSTCSR